jgi:hypothetical protein
MHVPVYSAAILIAALTLLGVLAYLHVPGAAVAAIAAVGTIVNWLAQSPQKTSEVVREYSMRPPSNGPTEVIQVRMPASSPLPRVDE